MAIDNVVGKTKIPSSFNKFALWNMEYKGKSVPKFESCGSFCSSGASTTMIYGTGYFKENKQYKK